MHGHACMAAGRAGRPHGAEQSRARTRRTAETSSTYGRQAGVDDDGDATELDAARRDRDELDDEAGRG